MSSDDGPVSKHIGKITRAFDAIIACPNCKPSRSMVIKTIHPGILLAKDKIDYQCPKCRAEKTEIVK